MESARYNDVIVWVNKALDRDPRHLFARELLVGAYWKKGDFRRQIEEDLKRAEARGLSEEARAALKEMRAEILHAYDHEGLAAANRCCLKHYERAGELICDGASRQRGNSQLEVGYAEMGKGPVSFFLESSSA